jgi:hypothetical protein
MTADAQRADLIGEYLSKHVIPIRDSLAARDDVVVDVEPRILDWPENDPVSELRRREDYSLAQLRAGVMVLIDMGSLGLSGDGNEFSRVLARFFSAQVPEPAPPDVTPWASPGFGLGLSLVFHHPLVWPVFVFDLEEGSRLSMSRWRDVWDAAAMGLTDHVRFEVQKEGDEARRERRLAAYRRSIVGWCVSHHFAELRGKDLGLGTVSPTGCERWARAFINGARCNYDGSMLRTLLKPAIAKGDDGGTLSTDKMPGALKVLARRADALAVAIDEEPEYAALAAHSAYRFGFRCWAVSTERAIAPIAAGVTPEHEAPTAGESPRCDPDLPPFWRDPHDPWGHGLLIRDVDLGTPGRATRDIEQWRGWKFGTLNPWVGAQGACPAGMSRNRSVRALSGDALVKTGDLFRRFDAETGQKVSRSGRIRFLGIQKPVGTTFVCGQFRAPVLDHVCGPESIWRRRSTVIAALGQARRLSAATERRAHKFNRHSANPNTLAVARELLADARQWLDQGSEAEDFLAASLLAGEAFELLGGSAPTTALRAFELMHDAEVAAESCFLGFSARLDLRRRRDEILSVISDVVAATGSDRLRWQGDAKQQIWSRLRSRFASSDQVQAADFANMEILSSSPWLRGKVTWVGWLLHRLLEAMRVPCAPKLIRHRPHLVKKAILRTGSSLVGIPVIYGLFLLVYSLMLPWLGPGEPIRSIDEFRSIGFQLARSSIVQDYVPGHLSDPEARSSQDRPPVRIPGDTSETGTHQLDVGPPSYSYRIGWWTFFLGNYCILALLIAVLLKRIGRQ